MADANRVSLQEYLWSSYEVDQDYLDGELHERHAGEYPHAALHGQLTHLLHERRQALNGVVLPSVRVQTSTASVCVPDVCVVSKLERPDDIIREVPLLGVEIVSESDRFATFMRKIFEYARMGVPDVWVIDPQSRRAWENDGKGGLLPVQSGVLTLSGTPVSISLADIFSEIDEAPSAASV